MAKEIPEADVVLGIGSNTQIVSAIEQAMSGERVLRFGKKTDLPLEGERVLSTLPYYAYLKIAEGCSNRVQLLRHPDDPREIPQPLHGEYSCGSRRAGSPRC